MQESNETPLFQAGMIDVDLEAEEMLEENGMTVEGVVRRHTLGIWGEGLGREFWAANDLAVKQGCLVISAYRMVNCDDHVQIVTLHDRSKSYVRRVPEY